MKKISLNMSTTIIGFIVVLLFSTIIITSIKPIYRFSIEAFDISAKSNLSIEEMQQNYSYIIDYVLYNDDENFNLPSLTFSEDGAVHFLEVKNLFELAKISLVVLSMILLILCIFYTKCYGEKKYIQNIGVSLIAVPIILTIVVSINFNGFFTLFHKLFFYNDKWLFNPKTDPIINILPEEFFALCASAIVCLCILFGISLCIIYFFSSKNRKRNIR